MLEGGSEDSPENEAGDREASGGGAQAAVFGNKDQAIARRDQALDFIRQRYPDYLASTEQMEEGILQSSYLRAVYGDFQTPRPRTPGQRKRNIFGREACGGNYGIRLCGSAHAGGSHDPGKFGQAGENTERWRITVSFPEHRALGYW